MLTKTEDQLGISNMGGSVEVYIVFVGNVGWTCFDDVGRWMGQMRGVSTCLNFSGCSRSTRTLGARLPRSSHLERAPQSIRCVGLSLNACICALAGLLLSWSSQAAE